MIYKIKLTIFIFIIAAFSILTFITPKENMSFFENRTLSKRPTLTKESLFSGNFFKDTETYLFDHFYKREFLLNINTTKDLLLNKVVINDIVISSDILLPYFKTQAPKYDEQNMELMIEKLNVFNNYAKENNINFLYVGIPEQSSAFKELYPSFLNNSNIKNNTLSNDFFNNLNNHSIDYINMYGMLDSYAHYSKTDHHYNFYGAYETYLTIMGYIKQNYFDIDIQDDISISDVDSNFLGSRNRKLLNKFKNNDKLHTYTPTTSISFERYDNGVLVEPDVFDDSKNNVYNYYMGGDIAETIIKTNRPELKNLLIVGDSFTNPIETLIYTSFNETRSLDFRYYNEKTLYEYLEDYKPDIILYIRDDMSYILNDGNGRLG